MTETGKRAQDATISDLGIKKGTAHWNLSPEELSKIAIEKGQATLTSTGAINVSTGEFTGRSPMDRFIVRDSITEDSVWWGDVNLSFDEDKFDALHKKVLDYLCCKEMYVRDSYACANEKYRINIRVVNEYPWSNMFAYNMFLRPTDAEIENFEEKNNKDSFYLNNKKLMKIIKIKNSLSELKNECMKISKFYFNKNE